MTSIQDLISNQKKKKEQVIKTQTENRENAGDLDHADIRKQVDAMIQSNKVMVFSKTYCPYCRQAKMALRSIPDLEFQIVEMDDGLHEGWQACVAEISKQRAVPEAATNNTMSVPQIFINQQYIGGADDISDMMRDERLSKMLGRPIS